MIIIKIDLHSFKLSSKELMVPCVYDKSNARLSSLAAASELFKGEKNFYR